MSTTLAQVEQETARRLGPYRRFAAAGGTASAVDVDDVRSTIDLGGWVGLYVLRRGESFALGDEIVGYDPADRVRRIKAYDPQTGTWTLDRAYVGAAVAAGEAVEVHHLEPTHELRPAVLAGLRRCYVEDRVEVTLAGVASERSLTAEIPWLTKRGQVRSIHAGDPASLALPSSVGIATPFERAGAVWVQLEPDPFPSRMLVSVLRPVSTLVNGLDSLVGPTDDADVLTVDLDYAAAVCHMEAWRYVPQRLQPLADGRIYLTKEGARSVKNQAVQAALGDVRAGTVTPSRFVGVMA